MVEEVLITELLITFLLNNAEISKIKNEKCSHGRTSQKIKILYASSFESQFSIHSQSSKKNMCTELGF